ncbi:MAG: flagellin [Pseudomonadota bacterium]
MNSINTNPSAMTALRSLSQTNSMLADTQSRISTGFKVATATDNAAYWSIATTMRSDNKALMTVQDALGLGSAKIDITYTGLEAGIDVVDEIKSKLVAAREPGVDRSKIQDEISQLQDQLIAIAESASFSGENWLAVDSAAANYAQIKSIVSSFTRTDNSVKTETIEIDTANLKLFDANDQSGILDSTFTTTGAAAVTVSVTTFDITVAGIDDADLDDLISNVDAKLQAMTTSASETGAIKKRISTQTDFVSTLIDSIDRGIGTLVDADMTKESTRLQALQTQQQLGVQSLSIANSASQNILALFQ